jgi:putative restriction endonuclease
MSNHILNSYLSKLSKLNRANTNHGKAPHKPLLLISIIELIEKGLVWNNRVYVNTDLVGAFQENWRLLVNTLHQPDFTQPFYYLQSEKTNGKQLWFLQPKLGCQINAHIKSVNRLAEVLDYGYFDNEFFQLLTDPVSKNIIKTLLLDTYFLETKNNFLVSKEKGLGYIHDLQDYILNEPEAKYRHIKIETEEDVFVRGGLFKKLVPKVYDSTCCFTGMRLESIYGYNFIDACHIVPFSQTHDDKINNGIALCPNLHRAFDRGLVSIDNEYRILISSQITENTDHPYGLAKLKGTKIRLPFGSRHYPSQENLDIHRNKIFKP